MVTSSAVSICRRFSSSVPQRLARRWLSTGVRTSSRGPVFKGLRRNADLAAQRMRHRRGDSHLYELAHEPAWTAKIDDAVVSRAARELPEVSARGAFDENALARADQAFADPARMRIDFPLKPGKPSALRLLWSIVLKVRCGGSQTPAVDERKRAVETDFVHQSQGRLEILLALPGEAHDEIRGDADTGSRGAQPAHDRFVFQGGVPALHRREHAVRTGLHRKVHLRRELFDPRVRIDQALGEFLRMRSGVTDASDSGNLCDVLEEKGKVRDDAVRHPAAVGVDVLAEQSHFFDALPGEVRDLGEHVVEGAGHFLSAGVGNDAEAAVLAAAFHSRYEGARSDDASRWKPVELLDFGEGDVHLRTAGALPSFDQFRK